MKEEETALTIEKYEVIGPDSDSDIEIDFHAVMESVKYEETNIPRSEPSLPEEKCCPSLCRLCAIPCDNMIDIFGPTILQKRIMEKIQHCLPVTVKKTDTLSKKVCRSCLQKLESYHQFYMTVIKAEKQLLVFHEKTKGRLGKGLRIHRRTCDVKADKGVSDTVNHRPLNTTGRSESRLETYPISESEKGSYFLRNRKPTKDTSDNDDGLSRVVVIDGHAPAAKNVGHQLIECHICKTTLQTIEECHTHARSHASTNYYPCCFCDITLETEPDWKEHWLQHEVLNSDTSLQQQMIGVHNRHETSTGNVSGIQLRNDEESNADRTKQAFECICCKKKLASNVMLEKHKKICPDNAKKYTCDHCKKVFQTKGNIRIHMLVHVGVRPFSCDICPKSYTTKQSRDEHRRIHTGERPYSCDVCPKSFTTKQLKNRHCRTHTGARPFSCDICSKSFTISWVRDNHRRVHTGERPFMCSICGNLFAKQSTMSNHMQYVHSKEKRYPCSLCDKWFKRACTRNIHMAGH